MLRFAQKDPTTLQLEPQASPNLTFPRLTERGGEPGVSAGLLCVMCIYGIAGQLGTKHSYFKKKKVICKVAVFLLWRSCETYCMKRWGVELRHFPWQPYENNQAEGQWRQGDAAKPYSLSTCLLRSASQLAVFPFRFLVNSWRASFITLVYFLLLSLSLVLQLQAP